MWFLQRLLHRALAGYQHKLFGRMTLEEINLRMARLKVGSV